MLALAFQSFVFSLAIVLPCTFITGTTYTVSELEVKSKWFLKTYPPNRSGVVVAAVCFTAWKLLTNYSSPESVWETNITVMGRAASAWMKSLKYNVCSILKGIKIITWRKSRSNIMQAPQNTYRGSVIIRTQSLKPPTSNSGKETFPINREKPWAGLRSILTVDHDRCMMWTETNAGFRRT